MNWIREAEQVGLRDMVSKSQFPCEYSFGTSLLLMFLCCCFCCGLVWGEKRKKEKESADPDVKSVFQNWGRCACVLYMWAFVVGALVSMCDQTAVDLHVSVKTPQTRRSTGKITSKRLLYKSTASLGHKWQLWQTFNFSFLRCRYLCSDSSPPTPKEGALDPGQSSGLVLTMHPEQITFPSRLSAIPPRRNNQKCSHYHCEF